MERVCDAFQSPTAQDVSGCSPQEERCPYGCVNAAEVLGCALCKIVCGCAMLPAAHLLHELSGVDADRALQPAEPVGSAGVHNSVAPMPVLQIRSVAQEGNPLARCECELAAWADRFAEAAFHTAICFRA